jgi:hypothetical protein
MGRQILDAGLRGLAVRDVLYRRYVIEKHTVLIPTRRTRDPDPDDRSVLAHVALLDLERIDETLAQRLSVPVAR